MHWKILFLSLSIFIISISIAYSAYVAVQVNSDIIIYTDSAGTYFAQNGYDNKIITSGNDFSAVMNTAISSIQPQKTIFIKSGTYVVNSLITINKNINIEGAGKEKTILSANSDVFNINPSSPSVLKIKGFQISFTGTNGIGIQLNNLAEGSVLEDIKISKGNTGIVINQASLSLFKDIYIVDFSNTGIFMDGDNGAENRFVDVTIQSLSSSSNNPSYGFRYIRDSNSADIGGLYFDHVIIGGNGKLANGISLESTLTGDQTPIYFWMRDSVIDGIKTNALYLQNVRELQIYDNWITAISGGIGLHSNGAEKMFINNNIIVGYPAVKLTGGTFLTGLSRFVGNWFESNIASNTFKTDSFVANSIALVDNMFYPSPPNISLQQGADNFIPITNGLTVITDAASPRETLKITNPTNNNSFYLRSGTNGKFEILDQTFFPALSIAQNTFLQIRGIYMNTVSSNTFTLNHNYGSTDYIALFSIVTSNPADGECVISNKQANSLTYTCTTSATRTFNTLILGYLP
ncbi:MAG: glycosyl hydrolase family 28-related protein [Candidatus Nitrosocaldaceae archaeon]